MKKYIKDGKVAILYSPEYGADLDFNDHSELRFDKDLVELVLEDRQEEISDTIGKKYPGEFFCEIPRLAIEWLDIGTKFKIHYYDGSDIIITEEDLDQVA